MYIIVVNIHTQRMHLFPTTAFRFTFCCYDNDMKMGFSERAQSSPNTNERTPRMAIHEGVASWAARLNEQFKQYVLDPERAGNMLEDDCRIAMRAFMTKRGGPYKKETLQEHEQQVLNNELAWSGALEKHIQEFYGTTDTTEIIHMWREKNQERDGALAESAVLTVLNKMLSGRFVAVRASSYDDYAHGVDTLILDRESGSVVCAFDEVVGVADGDRQHKKVERAREQLGKFGGMRIAYGLAFERGEDGAPRLARGELPNIPGFCISITHEELHALLRDGNFDPDAHPSEAEVQLFDKIVEALVNQKEVMSERMQPLQQSHIEELVAFAESRR